MGLVWIDPMDDNSTFSQLSGSFVAARNGNGLSWPGGTGGNHGFRISTTPTGVTGGVAWYTFGVAVKFGSIANPARSFMTMQGGNGQIQHAIRANPDGSLQAFRANTTSFPIPGALSAAGLVQANQWFYLEVKGTSHATAGAMTVRVNNTVVFSVAGTNTQGTVNQDTTIGEITVGVLSGSNNPTTVDDVYVCGGAADTTDPFLGDLVVETLYPNGNGAVNQWLGSDGNTTDNYLLVDEVGSPSTTDYVADSVPGHQDLYAMGDLVTINATVLAVEHYVYLRKMDSGAASFKILNRGGGGTITKSAALTPTTSSDTYAYPLLLNPDTGAAWTVAEVNALQSGVEIA
jgi:hypothetical protein